MSEISISTDALKAFAKECVRETLREVNKSALTKSEYARCYKLSRVTVNRMIDRGELTLNRVGKIIIY
jgi:hypothetical protein